MNVKKLSFYGFVIFFLASNFAYSVGCDPINTYCQRSTSQACELGPDIIQTVAEYVCIFVPDPKWYNPGNMKKKCLTEYKDKLIKGTSLCTTVAGLSCPSITGSPTLGCDTVINLVSECLKGNSNACVQAHSDVNIALTFGPACVAYSLYQTNRLEQTYETDIYGLIDTGLYSDISDIFGTLLGDRTFSNYVRGTVKYYKTSEKALDLTLTLPNEFRAKTTPGKIFFNVMTPPKDLIIHEMTHIWQYRNRGVQGQVEDGCRDTFNVGSNLSKQYDFLLVTGKKFADYGVEQQAEIIQYYYLYKNRLIGPCDPTGNFKNCSAYPDDASRLLALKNTISGSSGSGSTSSASGGTILFSGTCTAQGCEGPSRNCSSQNGRFELNSSSYVCYAR
jgi:hypothetical protein